MLAAIGLLLIVFWAAGLFIRVAGGFIHILLVLAVILIVLHFLRA